jgi:alpha-glucosidase
LEVSNIFCTFVEINNATLIKMKRINTLAFFLLLACTGLMAKSFNITSPDGKLKAQIEVGKTVTYQLNYGNQPLLQSSKVAMKIADGKTWGEGSKLKSAATTQHKGSIKAFAYKKDVVTDNYAQLALQFKEGFSILFRLYNEGMAYRFVSNQKQAMNVENEIVDFNFAKDFETLTPYVRDDGDYKDQLHNSFEATYTPVEVSKFNPKKLAFLPLIVEADNGVKMAIAEADVENYPCMFVKPGDETTALKGFFAPYPKEIKQGGHNRLEQLVTSAENYIAQAKAGQNFPWRIVNVATADEQLLNNDMVYRLASPNRIGDTSWIKPGKVAWDWWNDWGVYNVDFKTGVNTQTYEYYIDFASKHGIEYVILDEGWAVNKKADLMQVIPEIDLQKIIAYGKEKNVGIILWAGYKAFDRDMENVCKHYAEMGVKGFKIDFMNRNDAECVDFHYRSAATAAKYHLMCDFHGTYAPTGLNRTYPNVINFEGVDGQEQNKWANMEQYNQVQYDVTMPFARMLAGQIDYTQGAMINSTKNTFHPSNSRPMSQGTRCHQLAEYVVFLSPLNMLCDSPTHYDAEPVCTDFIAKIPTTWDETLPLKSEIGEYIAMARKKGGKWYVGVLTNWTPRDLELDLTPLKVAGKKAVMFADGANADKFAEDFTKKEIEIPADGKLKVHLAPGGGLALEF